MQKLHFSIDINAPKQKVWDILWGEATYPKWTSAFSEGSHAVTDWQEGSKIHFLDSKGDGMYSRVERRVDGEQMSFRHLGEIKDGEEQPEHDATNDWANAMEDYRLKEDEGTTKLTVDFDSTDQYLDYFRETFPKALEQVKRLSEPHMPDLAKK